MDAQIQFVSNPASSLHDVASVPSKVTHMITILLRFLSALLRNSSSKSVFNSVEELVDLLAAADDSVASLALEALCNLATPPCLHKQQSPEVNQHTTLLHSSKTASHRRLVALARGWGTRGSGLGLFTCVTADDSEFGQGSLPAQAGELNFSFSKAVTTSAAVTKTEEDNTEYQLVRIQLSKNEILDETNSTLNSNNDNGDTLEDADMADANNTDEKKDTSPASNKRRRVDSLTGRPKGGAAKTTKSTAELFFTCLNKAGGRSNLQEDRLFALLADIRLAKSFYSAASRVQAVERRLRALTAILQAHPSQEVMSGYFQAQPELCTELIDLLRPKVSSANVSASSAPKVTATGQDALGALASSPGVPYSVRMLAVESITALVGRRDGTTGALTGTARHSSVLGELGVGKGQYLGLLPTLIRYSLASLGCSFSAVADQTIASNGDSTAEDDSNIDALHLGLAFVDAAQAPAAPRLVQLERALEFIDSVLTLTSAIVSTPTGTSALTDCGLIPALLTTAATDSQSFLQRSLPDFASYSQDDFLRVRSFSRFITAQAIQILEGAIVTHNNALSAFHDLQGVEVLTSRLSKEVSLTRPKSLSLPASAAETIDAMECDTVKASSDRMDLEMDDGSQQQILSSQRVLLFSIVTCLTVVFHQESASSASTTAPSGGTQLRKPEFTQALIDIMDNVTLYGGHLASLIATLLSDVLNGDPHVVHYVHKTGIAKSFLDMLTGKKTTDDAGTVEYEPILPPVPELIMALPNVIAALALTEDGAKAIKEVNPFPAMLRLFRHPKYAMPQSRCLLNEMTAIVGTGLDEVMRHTPLLKPLVVSAIADALNRIVLVADDLTKREQARFDGKNMEGDHPPSDLENERTCLMQYVLNFGQLLEQILHNEDHCDPFVTAGGLEALLRLFPSVMPTDYQFLSHVSSLSCPAVSTLHHSTAEESLCLAYKCISLRYDPLKLIRTTIETVKLHVAELEETQSTLRQITSGKPDDERIVRIDASFVLEGLPLKPLHHLSPTDDKHFLTSLSKYLRAVSNVQWASSLLGVAIKTACQRGQEHGTGWSRTEREWKKELSSKPFQELVEKLSIFHQSAIFSVCQIRSTDGYAKRERERLTSTPSDSEAMRYRLRIVCPEGAVVRDGIEIDSCASVGSMEMGEIAEAFDRCINSSGILRYRTRRGWVSEMTRGHGREPVAEVVNFWRHDNHELPEGACPSPPSKKRIEAPIPDLRTVSVGVMARLQTSYSELFNALSKCVLQGVRSLPATSVSFKEGDAGEHATTMMRILSSNVVQSLSRCKPNEFSATKSPKGTAMYLGCMVSHIHACLFDEKRERRMVNVPLLLFLMEMDGDLKAKGAGQDSKLTLLDAIRFIFTQSLTDFRARSQSSTTGNTINSPVQLIDRTVAASLPAALLLLRRLMAGSFISSSPASSVLSRIKRSDLAQLLGREINGSGFKETDDDEALFSPEDFVKSLHFSVSEVVRDAWVDPRFIFAPPSITHPFATLVCDVINALEDAEKKVSQRSLRSAAADSNDNVARGLPRVARPFGELAAVAAQQPPPPEVFEPSDDAIARLEEMGFSHDHAIDALENVQSNRVETAMEYALSHPPPSPIAIERRRVQREERLREREADAAAQGDANAGTAADGETGNGENANEDAAPAVDSQGNQNDGSGEAMEVDQAGNRSVNNKTESGSEKTAGKEEETPKEIEEVSKAKELLQKWVEESPRVSCNILGSLTVAFPGLMSDSDQKTLEQGDAEGEALAAVVTSFLLDLCQRYPDHCDGIATEVFQTLKAQIKENQNASFQVREGKERSFAALCQASVLLTRALPKTRTLVLKENILGMLVLSVSGALKRVEHDGWPVWMASAILMLDVMAQPVVGFPEKKKHDKAAAASTDDNDDKNGDSELTQVREEHEKQKSELTEKASRIFCEAETIASTFADSIDKGSKDDAKSSSDKVANDGSQNHEQKGRKTDSSKEDLDTKVPSKFKASELFASIPAYFPLIPDDLKDSCMGICIDLLRRGKSPDSGKKLPPPGIVHATMLLLLRLLRTPKISAQCLHVGAAETILALSRQCRFTGNSGLVTLILRRLLEDEPTLQAAMETEIRSAISKLTGKRRDADTQSSGVAYSAFAEAVTPVFVRDPICFLKAFLLTAKIEPCGETMVKILTPEERSRNQKALNKVIETKAPTVRLSLLTGTKPPTRRRSTSLSRHRKGGTIASKIKATPQRHHSSSKKAVSSKKHKKEKNDLKHSGHGQHSTQLASPANHIVTLLITNILASTSTAADDVGVQTEKFLDDKTFLGTGPLLEVLSDLVLAVPACASAVQKFRLQRTKAIAHALDGCPTPPKTFLNYLLHVFLPLDRCSFRNNQQLWERATEEVLEETEAINIQKKQAFRINKVAQSSARLIVALVARPGEGRKAVIKSLTSALSGGLLGTSSQVFTKTINGSAKELHALQAWGELCTGLAAPRSNGKTPDGISSLSLEVIQKMLELGMAHALLYALHRVRLENPMAASTCSALLFPLEILTRSSVGDALEALADKEAAARSAKAENAKKAAISAEHESDTVIEEAFHQAPADPLAGDLDPDESDSDDEVDMEHHMDDGSAVDDEEISSDSEDAESDDSGSDGEEGDSDDEESVLDEEDELEESDESSGDEMDDDGDWNINFQNDFQSGDDNFDADDEDDDEDIEENAGLDEGWTRVESGAGAGVFGSVAGHRLGLNPAHGGPLTARTRGFIDAAEQMIGSLLRNGEINGDALAEIEGSLGIRIMNAQSGRPFRDGDGFAESMGARMGGAVAAGDNRQPRRENSAALGTLPHVQQRSQPGSGYSSSGGGRWIENSCMEYVFGGPAISGSSRNYDLISPIVHPEEPPPNTSQLDLQLFPGGPAAAAQARSQHSLHPLICGVDLPPVSALVSDLLPHGIRCTLHNLMVTRRPGESPNFNSGNCLFLTSNGNIIRSNRQGGAPLSLVSQSRNVAVPAGWTDDGLPFDATASQFSHSFENALRDCMIALRQVREASSDTARAAEIEANNVEGDDVMHTAEDGEEGQGQAENESENDAAANAESETMELTSGGDATTAASETGANDDGDGDGVASSLAAGLRLSPGSEASNDAMQPAPALEALAGDGEANADVDTSMAEAAQQITADNEMEEQPESRQLAAESLAGEEGDNSAQPAEETTGQEQPASSERQPNSNGLVCPPDIDEEVFNSLPVDMQRDCIEQHQQQQALASQLDQAQSNLDPEALAALPEDIRREVMMQEEQERRTREQVPADPSRAEEMDNASFLASLTPDLRTEILLTADESFLNSLPEGIVAEANVLRERANAAAQRRQFEQRASLANSTATAAGQGQNGEAGGSSSARRKARSGKLRVDMDRNSVVYIPPNSGLMPPISKSDVKSLLRLLYLLAPVRPARLLQKVFLNLTATSALRSAMSSVFVCLLHEDDAGARAALDALTDGYADEDGGWRKMMDAKCGDMPFPPKQLFGTVPEVLDREMFNPNISLIRRSSASSSTAASIAANLPASSAGVSNQQQLPPVVQQRIVESLMHLCKNSPRFCLHSLVTDIQAVGEATGAEGTKTNKTTVFDRLLDFLAATSVRSSSANLENLLALLEGCVSPLSHISKNSEGAAEISKHDLDAATGKF